MGTMICSQDISDIVVDTIGYCSDGRREELRVYQASAMLRHPVLMDSAVIILTSLKSQTKQWKNLDATLKEIMPFMENERTPLNRDVSNNNETLPNY
jgi:hypothetical protein